MKTLQTLSITVLMATTMISCQSNAQEQTAKEMLADSVRQKEIFDAICNNHEQMMQFMDHMMQNEHAMQMMEGNHKMMQHMKGNHQMMMNMMKQDTAMAGMMMGNMMQMMENDSAMCNMMGSKMMDNQHMMDMMQDCRRPSTGLRHQS